ncbi:zinc-binding dehydrogenase [Actinoplanes sp. NPDC049548]|uniref:zinc-binding dehydrogenase n=1 Tax=Actinoplanes sp. NPDC049548 TaxID=3155152 RepID=UPI00343E29D7
MTSSIGGAASHAVRAAGSAVRHVRAAVSPSAARPAGAGQPASGWLVVTVVAEPSDIDTAELPAPLAEFGDRIEARVRAAPGGKRTELAARLRDRLRLGTALGRLTGNDPRADLRSALRRAKQLKEVGEVLAVPGYRRLLRLLPRAGRLGGWAGSHAPYIRVPYADQGAFAIPDGVSDERALFASDAAPTGWTGAHQAGVGPGDVVAVWGAGGVGQMAARAAMLMGAERVVVIDRYDNRLQQVRTYIGAETLDYEKVDNPAELREMTGGRGPDVCIEAVGMEAHTPGPQYLYDQVKQQMRLQTDRPAAVREAIYACRKGGTVITLEVFAGLVDKFPLGAVMNKALTLRGAQQRGHRYIPEILGHMSRDEVKTEHLATHVMPLGDGPKGYRMFKNKEDGCVRAVFRPHA